MKAVLRGQFIVVNTYIKKMVRYEINSIVLQFKELKYEQNNLKAKGRK